MDFPTAAQDGFDDLNQLVGGLDRPGLAPANNGFGDTARFALFPKLIDHVGKLLLAHTVYQISCARPLRRIHSHIQRSASHEGESPRSLSQLIA